MALVYNHLKRGVKQKRQVPMVIMVLGFKIKTSRCKNKKLSFEKNNPPVALKLGIFIYTLKREHVKTELLKDKALRGRKS